MFDVDLICVCLYFDHVFNVLLVFAMFMYVNIRGYIKLLVINTNANVTAKSKLKGPGDKKCFVPCLSCETMNSRGV